MIVIMKIFTLIFIENCILMLITVNLKKINVKVISWLSCDFLEEKYNYRNVLYVDEFGGKYSDYIRKTMNGN